MSDQGIQHNKCPQQDQIFDNPSALCLALWAKNRIRFRVGGMGGGGGGVVMHPIGSLRRQYDFLSLHFFSPSDLHCLRSSRSKYNASTINYFFFYSTLRPKIIIIIIHRVYIALFSTLKQTRYAHVSRDSE